MKDNNREKVGLEWEILYIGNNRPIIFKRVKNRIKKNKIMIVNLLLGDEYT